MSEVKGELADEERPDSPWDGAELVIYSADSDHAEDPDAPYTPWGQGLGLVSLSLWARFEDEETEIPIYSAASPDEECIDCYVKQEQG